MTVNTSPMFDFDSANIGLFFLLGNVVILSFWQRAS